MSDNARWVHPFGSAGDGDFQVCISDALDGWRHTSLRVATLAPAAQVSLDAGDSEVIVVPHDLYYLNVMAGPGPTRAWLICDDPAHARVRASWAQQDVGPRLPIGGPR
ncbi:KduI/IolB family protein [Micromonospora rhizosphaerae]|uniref:KduI/IolB family protein n=1 Tax=Micromonospora rhizosphaerae TaxID=568872 RepID=A0A1C6T1E3_9ACTN|nr:5-deoxy-glucuronate isomerase [Micromonospora rhizosphaerae]SCL35578.1 KduI/IolB family protein [Micromonospora rhizosphaerae]